MADIDDRWYRITKGADGRPRKVPTARHGTGSRWAARWRDAGGKQRMRAFDRKLDADNFLTGLRADLMRGSYIDPRAGSMALRAYAEQRWLPAQLHLRPNSAATYGSHLRVHILPALGGRQLGAVQRTDCKSFAAALSAALAPSTVHTVYAVLRSLMQSAVDDKLIAANPCSRVPLPVLTAHVVEPMAAGQVLALADAITPRYRLAVLLGAAAGLREGEALGLTVPRLDFLRRHADIIEQMQNRQLSPLKTKASRRKVPLDDVVLTAATEHMQRWAPGPHQLIITNRCGGPVQRNSFGHCWREAVADARTCGKPPAPAGTRRRACGEQCSDPAHCLPAGTRFHDLRHFYASALIAANLHPKAIQARLGHATMAETMDVYGHLFPASDELGRGALDAALMCAQSAPATDHDNVSAGQR